MTFRAAAKSNRGFNFELGNRYVSNGIYLLFVPSTTSLEDNLIVTFCKISMRGLKKYLLIINNV